MKRQSLGDSFSAAVLAGTLLTGGALGCMTYLTVEIFSLKGHLEQTETRLSEIGRKLERFEKELPPQPLP